MKLIIDRSKWLRGEGHEGSMLLRPSDSKMCCLGFFGIACGLKEGQIYEVEDPSSLACHSEDTVWHDGEWLYGPTSTRLSADCDYLIDVNDNPELKDSASLTEQEREDKIATIFAKHGVEVEFVG